MAGKSKNAKKSIDSVVSQKHLRKGLAIYKTGRSSFWNIRLRDPLLAKYVVRSSKEKTQFEATRAAYEFADGYRSKAHDDFAQTKATSFEHYAKMLMAEQKGRSRWSDGDSKLLNRPKDGIIFYFGKYDVTKINTGLIRKYLAHLDENRVKPLAQSTKSKHVIIINKVLLLAVDDGLMSAPPPMPKLKTVDTPRPTFTDDEYKRFSEAALECARRGDIVRGVKVTGHHAKMFSFVVDSFLRPTESELFGLKHKDLQLRQDPHHLEMNVRSGKTGRRTSVTMPMAVAIYGSSGQNMQLHPPDPEAYVWMPEYPNRTTAISTARRIFNHILKEAGIDDPDKKLTPYSLRHYALQKRLRSSDGKVNIHTLAKNAGTSVDQLERFYLSKMAPTKEMIENLHFRPEPSSKQDLSRIKHDLILSDVDHIEYDDGDEDA